MGCFDRLSTNGMGWAQRERIEVGSGRPFEGLSTRRVRASGNGREGGLTCGRAGVHNPWEVS